MSPACYSGRESVPGWYGRIEGRYCGRASRFFLLLVVVPLFWAPWSMNWTSEQGNRDYLRGDFTNAIKWYQRSMRFGPRKRRGAGRTLRYPTMLLATKSGISRRWTRFARWMRRLLTKSNEVSRSNQNELRLMNTQSTQVARGNHVPAGTLGNPVLAQQLLDAFDQLQGVPPDSGRPMPRA